MNGRKRGSGEGSYYRRKDGTWNFRVMIDGVRYSADGRTKTLAKLSALEKAEVGAKPDAIVTFGELVEEWSGLSATRVKLAPSTQDQYRSLLRTHALPTLEKARLDQLTKRVLARAVDGIEGSSSTRRSTYAALVKVLDYGVDTGRLGRNMAREVRRPHAAPAARRELSNAEAGELIKAASGHRWEVAVWLSLGCGLRRGEVLALRWSDFNRDLTELAVTGNVTRTSAGLVRGAPKTRRGQRMVPVPTAVTTALRLHRAAQAESRLLVGPAWTRPRIRPDQRGGRNRRTPSAIACMGEVGEGRRTLRPRNAPRSPLRRNDPVGVRSRIRGRCRRTARTRPCGPAQHLRIRYRDRASGRRRRCWGHR